MGLFAGFGRDFDLGGVLLESSVVVSHHMGLTVGGKGFLEEMCGSSDPDGDSERCDQPRSDFATSRTLLTLNNHLNAGPVAMALGLFYGKKHSSKNTMEAAEEIRDFSKVNPYLFGVHATLGYEFGHGKRR